MSRRISYQEALELFLNAPIEELQKEAVKIRNEKNPPDRVTFVLDSNPNYTNVCNVDCTFCAFYRHPGAKDAYTKTVDQVMEHLEFARRAGITTVLLQGGVNPELKLDYYVSLVKEARRRYPEIYPHFFSAPEIYTCAEVSGVTIKEVFQALWDAGQRTFPGGGAEILSEKVRLKVSPKKMAPGGWIEVHRAAHQVGIRSTATMMYGHIEEPEDIIEHFDALRTLQDETGGFTAFIPWSYKRDRTALRRSVKSWIGKDAYYRILAMSRIYLDNFDHVQASWFSEGKGTGVDALHYGADDFGGTILEENVHRATGFIAKTHHQGIVDMIASGGYRPAQRNPLYEILREYEPGESLEIPEDQERFLEDDQVAILKQ